MDYIENKTNEELYLIVESIDKYLLINDYENAFIFFLIQIARMNSLDRDDLIRYFYKKFIETF